MDLNVPTIIRIKTRSESYKHLRQKRVTWTRLNLFNRKTPHEICEHLIWFLLWLEYTSLLFSPEHVHLTWEKHWGGQNHVSSQSELVCDRYDLFLQKIYRLLNRSMKQDKQTILRTRNSNNALRTTSASVFNFVLISRASTFFFNQFSWSSWMKSSVIFLAV